MASSAPASADLSHYTGPWALDPTASSVTFQTKALWVLPAKGHLAVTQGEGVVGGDGGLRGHLVIDAASIDTGNKRRDDHLRSEDFLEIVKYPTIDFEVTSGRLGAADRLELEGSLTIHGQSRPLSLTATVQPDGDAVKLAAEVTIDRRDWGVSWAKMGAGVITRLAINARFARS